MGWIYNVCDHKCDINDVWVTDADVDMDTYWYIYEHQCMVVDGHRAGGEAQVRGRGWI